MAEATEGRQGQSEAPREREAGGGIRDGGTGRWGRKRHTLRGEAGMPETRREQERGREKERQRV